jgi:hypothetical protein
MIQGHRCPYYDGMCAGIAGHAGDCGNAASFRLRGELSLGDPPPAKDDDEDK